MAEYIYKAFNPAEDIIGGKSKMKTFPIWTDRPSDVDTNQESILGTTDNPMYLSPSETGSWEANYYYNVFNDNPSVNLNAEPQFSFAFATTQSIELETTLGEEYKYTYPSKAVYSQFLSILEEQTISNPAGLFKIAPAPGITSLEDIRVAYIISIARSRIKDRIELDTWQLNLSSSSPGGVGTGRLLNLINQTGSTVGATSVPIIIGTLPDYTGVVGTGSYGTEMGLFYPQR